VKADSQAGLYAAGGVIAGAGIAVWTVGLTKNPPSQDLQNLGYVVFGIGFAVILAAMIDPSSLARKWRQTSIAPITIEPRVQGNTMELLVGNAGSDWAKFKAYIIEVNPCPANRLTHWALRWSGSDDPVQEIGPSGDSWPLHLGEAGLWRRASDGELAGSIAIERFGSSNVPFNYEGRAECDQRSPVIVTVRITRITPPAHFDRKFKISLETVSPSGEALPRLVDVTDNAITAVQNRPHRSAEKTTRRRKLPKLGLRRFRLFQLLRQRGKRRLDRLTTLAGISGAIVLVLAGIVVAALAASGGHSGGHGHDHNRHPTTVSARAPTPSGSPTAAGPSPVGTLPAPGGGGGVTVAFAKNGTLLAVRSANGRTYLWTVSAPGQRWSQAAGPFADPGSQGINGVAVSSNGNLLATADGNGTTYLWTVRSAHKPPIELLVRNDTAMDSVAFSPDGQYLAIGDSGGSVFLLPVASPHSCCDTIYCCDLRDRDVTVVESLAFSANGKYLAAGYSDGITYVFTLSDGKDTGYQIFPDPGSQGVNSVALSPDGKWLAAGDADGAVYLWMISSNNHRDFLYSQSTDVEGVTFSSDSMFFFAADGNGAIYVWAVSDYYRKGSGPITTPRDILPGFNGKERLSIAYRSNSTLLAVGDAAGGVEFWPKKWLGS
jgi:WD40 repeat protein